jgi:hypothetical protein
MAHHRPGGARRVGHGRPGCDATAREPRDDVGQQRDLAAEQMRRTRGLDPDAVRRVR